MLSAPVSGKFVLFFPTFTRQQRRPVGQAYSAPS